MGEINWHSDRTIAALRELLDKLGWKNSHMTKTTSPCTAMPYHGLLRASFNFLVKDGAIADLPMERGGPR